MNDLTIILPTYNRPSMLLRCIKSIRAIYADCTIIVGDSSQQLNDKLVESLNDKNIQFIDLRKHECDIYSIYTQLLEHVKTKYVIIVEDDDVLINKDVHEEICQILSSTDVGVLTFANQIKTDKCIEYFLTDNFDLSYSSIHDIPAFWNGNFQFGSAYFNTKMLLTCFKEWILQDKARTFDGSIDESITLLAIYKQNQYIHIGKVGLSIGVNNDNVSWNNLMLTMYSSSTYIADLQKTLNETSSWRRAYEMIQLKEIQTMCPSISYADVFENKFFNNLKKTISAQLKNNIPCKQLKMQLLTKLDLYKQVKKYNILQNSYVKTS